MSIITKTGPTRCRLIQRPGHFFPANDRDPLVSPFYIEVALGYEYRLAQPEPTDALFPPTSRIHSMTLLDSLRPEIPHSPHLSTSCTTL